MARRSIDRGPQHRGCGAFSRREALAVGGSLAAGWPLPAFSREAAADRPQHNLGLNLSRVDYYSSERPFVNLYHSSSPYVSLGRNGQWNKGEPLVQDRHGWISRLQPGQVAAFIIDLHTGHPNTTYRISYDGPPQALRIGGEPGLEFQKTENRQRMLVRVLAPVRNVVIHEVGRENSHPVFADSFLARCGEFAVLRFMNWSKTNQDRPVRWPTRVTDRHYTQAGEEVALEHMVNVCNECGSGIWYCVHHRADDDYVRKVAEYLKAHLQPGLPVYVEHSNEVWNPIFAQHSYCRAQGDMQRLPRPSWMSFHLRRTARIAELFRAAGVTVQAVVGVQSANVWPLRQALRHRPEGLDAIGIAPYFGGRIGRMPQHIRQVLQDGLPAVFQLCRQSIARRRTEMSDYRQLAKQHGMQLVGYEGGQHLVAVGQHRRNQELVDLLIAANRDSQMYDLYREYLQAWNEETERALLCLYHSVSIPSKFGSWGLLEYEGQAETDAHKYRAVMDYIESRVARHSPPSES